MIKTDDRIQIGLKVLGRLSQDFRAGWEHYSHAIKTNAAERKGVMTRLLPTVETSDAGDILPAERPMEALPWPPYLDELLEQTGELATHSVILGVCDDALPFLLDLTNPAPGSILIAADHGGGKTRLLRAILASGVSLNSPGQVVYHLVSNQLDELAPLEEQDHCQEALAIEELSAEKLINKLAMIAEARRRDKPRDPAIILAIDDLAALLDTLDDQTFSRLYWLIKHGPRAYIWTVATLSTQKAERVHPRLLEAFRTRLIGRIQDRRMVQFLTGDENLDARSLENGFQFCVPYGVDWLRFWLCEPAPEEGDPQDQPLSSYKDEQEAIS